VQPQTSPLTGENPVTFTYTYVKRVDPTGTSGAEYECFVGTTIPNDAGRNTDTTTTLLLTEAGTGTRCSRLADPYQSGMKLVGTKTAIEGNNNSVHYREKGIFYSFNIYMFLGWIRFFFSFCSDRFRVANCCRYTFTRRTTVVSSLLLIGMQCGVFC